MIGAIISKKVVKSAFDSINRRDISAFLAKWSEDATFIYPGNLSVSGKIKGKKAIERWFQRFMEQFPNVKFTLKNVYVQNIFALGSTNVLAAEWDITGTNREGKAFRNSGVTIINVKKGKAILVRDYIFDLEMLKEAWGEKQL